MPHTDSDARIAKRTNGSTRSNRLSLDRSTTEDRASADSIRRAERRAMLIDVNQLLPRVPDTEAVHFFWATTTNPKDSIENRQRLGYSFVTRAELPDFHLSTQKSGELTEDRITVNEMVLMKIAKKDWNDDMLYKHYDLPKEALDDLKNRIRFENDGRGNRIGFTGGEFQNGIADGFGTLSQTGSPRLEG